MTEIELEDELFEVLDRARRAGMGGEAIAVALDGARLRIADELAAAGEDDCEDAGA